MKYIFFIVSLLGLASLFSSANKSEMLAYGTVFCLGLAASLLASQNEKLKTQKEDEGR